MTRLFHPNPGDRPSRLELGRQLTGETPADPADPRLAAYREEVAASARQLPPFDAAILRAAAARLDDAPPTRARPLPGRRAWLLSALAAAAAALLLVVLPPPGQPNRIKGRPSMAFYTWRDGVVAPGRPGQALSEGDRLRFRLHAAGASTVVLLSVDGRGVVTVYYPAEGDEPEPVPPAGGLLPGSVELDEAPGPEVFVAVFDPGSVQAALELVEEAWRQGGHDAVEDLARTDPAVATFRIDKEAR